MWLLFLLGIFNIYGSIKVWEAFFLPQLFPFNLSANQTLSVVGCYVILGPYLSQIRVAIHLESEKGKSIKSLNKNILFSGVLSPRFLASFHLLNEAVSKTPPPLIKSALKLIPPDEKTISPHALIKITNLVNSMAALIINNITRDIPNGKVPTFCSEVISVCRFNDVEAARTDLKGH